MSDFISKKIKELCDLSGGTGFKEIYQGSKTGDYPFIKVSDMNLPENEKFIFNSNNWISEETAKKLKAKLFPKDSIVFAKVGAALFLNKRRILTRETSIDNNMMAAVPKVDIIHPLFLYYSFLSIDFQMFAQDGALPSVNQTDVGSIQLKIPSTKKEQEKIAEILTSVDKVIELTEIEIEKLKNLKKGMMQDLLTKGIGHTKFKNSPIGKIPESWGVKYIGELCRVGTGGRDTQDKVEGGKYPFYVRSAQIERIDTYSFDGIAILTVGDGVGTGKVFHYTEGKIEIHQRVYKLSDFNESIYPRFLYYFFSENFLYRVEKFSAKTSVDSVRMEMITKMFTPLPSLDEQIKIANACQSIEKTIESKESKLERTKNLKKGLMQDLLTGKVRVKV